jgi:hypothetical protein
MEVAISQDRPPEAKTGQICTLPLDHQVLAARRFAALKKSGSGWNKLSIFTAIALIHLENLERETLLLLPVPTGKIRHITGLMDAIDSLRKHLADPPDKLND